MRLTNERREIMVDNVIYYQTMGAIKELTTQINIKIAVPSQTSIEDVKEMAQGIIDIMKTYEEKLKI